MCVRVYDLLLVNTSKHIEIHIGVEQRKPQNAREREKTTEMPVCCKIRRILLCLTAGPRDFRPRKLVQISHIKIVIGSFKSRDIVMLRVGRAYRVRFVLVVVLVLLLAGGHDLAVLEAVLGLEGAEVGAAAVARRRPFRLAAPRRPHPPTCPLLRLKHTTTSLHSL